MNINQEWDSQSIKYYCSVEKIKKRLRKTNLKYLHSHPEIRAIIRFLLHEAINAKPTNIFEFTANLFNCNNTPLLVPMINKHLKRVNEQLRKGRYSEYDGEMLLHDTPSSHSILSKTSVSTHAESILRYALVLKHPEGCAN